MMLNAWGRHRTLLLLLALQKQHLGFWSLYILLSIICPNYACTHLFSVPYAYFVFCCPRRHLSRCKQCTEGLRSQVPTYLNSGHMGPPCMGCPPLPWCSGYQIPGLREHLSLLTTHAGPCRDTPPPFTKAAVSQSVTQSCLTVTFWTAARRASPSLTMRRAVNSLPSASLQLPRFLGKLFQHRGPGGHFLLNYFSPSLSSESDSLVQCLHFPPVESGEPSPGISAALTQTLGLAPYTGVALQLLRNSHVTCQLSSSSSVFPCTAVADL